MISGLRGAAMCRNTSILLEMKRKNDNNGGPLGELCIHKQMAVMQKQGYQLQTFEEEVCVGGGLLMTSLSSAT